MSEKIILKNEKMINLFKQIKSLKLFSVTVLLAAILVPTNFSQAATFTASEPTLRAGNFSQNPGSNNWQTSVSGSAGETLSFLVYYNNNSGDTASQTMIKLNIPSGQFTSNSVTANVWAQNANQISGSVNVSLSSSQTLTYIPGSVRWYPACYTTQTRTLPNGQSGSEIISSGLNLGDIANGSIGCIVVRVQVSNNSSGSVPIVNTNSAYSIYQNSAYLSGNVDPNNSNTDFWFEYSTNNSLGTTVGFQSVGAGDSSISESYYLSGLQPNTTYYFRAVARNQYGTTYGNILNFYTQSGYSNQTMPTVFTNSVSSINPNSAVLNGSVDPNGSQADAWFEYGTTQSMGYTTGYRSVGSFDYSTDFSTYISGLSTGTIYYYRVVARNQYGTTYGGILTFNTSGSGDNSSGQPSVITQTASPVYQNSALVNGSVNPNGGYTTAWFQWGTNNNLGNTTISQSVGSGNNYINHPAALTGLSQNTTYYYRLVANNNSGTVYGNILSFNTQAATPSVVYQPIQPQIIYVPIITKAATSSLVLLISNSDRETAVAGNELHYVVVYKNLSQQKLTNVVLKIIFPLETNYISSNPKAISLEGNNITYQVGDLDPGEEGFMDIEFMVKNSVRNNDSLIFSATLEYRDADNTFHSNNTFLSVLATNRLSLLAALLSIGGFSGIFWGLILGLVIGFLIYWFGLRKRFVKNY